MLPRLTVAHHPIPTHNELEELRQLWEHEKSKAETELREAQTLLDKERAQKKIQAARHCLYEIRFVVDHISSGNKRRAIEVYSDAVAVLYRINDLPEARDRLKQIGFTENDLKDLMKEFEEVSGESETNAPAPIWYRRKAEEHLSTQHRDISTTEGQDTIEEVVKDMMDFYKGEVRHEMAPTPWGFGFVEPE